MSAQHTMQDGMGRSAAERTPEILPTVEAHHQDAHILRYAQNNLHFSMRRDEWALLKVVEKEKEGWLARRWRACVALFSRT